MSTQKEQNIEFLKGMFPLLEESAIVDVYNVSNNFEAAIDHLLTMDAQETQRLENESVKLEAQHAGQENNEVKLNVTDEIKMREEQARKEEEEFKKWQERNQKEEAEWIKIKTEEEVRKKQEEEEAKLAQGMAGHQICSFASRVKEIVNWSEDSELSTSNSSFGTNSVMSDNPLEQSSTMQPMEASERMRYDDFLIQKEAEIFELKAIVQQRDEEIAKLKKQLAEASGVPVLAPEKAPLVRQKSDDSLLQNTIDHLVDKLRTLCKGVSMGINKMQEEESIQQIIEALNRAKILLVQSTPMQTSMNALNVAKTELGNAGWKVLDKVGEISTALKNEVLSAAEDVITDLKAIRTYDYFQLAQAGFETSPPSDGTSSDTNSTTTANSTPTTQNST